MTMCLICAGSSPSLAHPALDEGLRFHRVVERIDQDDPLRRRQRPGRHALHAEVVEIVEHLRRRRAIVGRSRRPAGLARQAQRQHAPQIEPRRQRGGLDMRFQGIGNGHRRRIDGGRLDGGRSCWRRSPGCAGLHVRDVRHTQTCREHRRQHGSSLGLPPHVPCVPRAFSARRGYSIAPMQSRMGVSWRGPKGQERPASSCRP